MPRFAVVPLREAKQRGTPSERQRIAQEYAGYIEQLGSGQAGKLTPGEGETPLTIRRRLTYAAKETGKRLRITRSGNEVYFWLDPHGLPIDKRNLKLRHQTGLENAAYPTEDGTRDTESIEGIRRGLEQMTRGEGRPAEEVFAEFRARHSIMNG